MSFKKKQPEKTEKKNETNERETIFVEGFHIFKPNEKAPDFILAEVILTPEVLIKWMEGNVDLLEKSKYGEQFRLTLKESKSGTYYFAVNTYKK